MDSDHTKAMMKIQTQANIEKAQHDETMKRIQQQSAKMETDGVIDNAQFSGKCLLRFYYP